MSEMLTVLEERELVDLEAVIERGMQTFVEVGNALQLIREKRLYRVDFGTFEDYCQERWGWERRHSYRLMDAAEAVGSLSPMGHIPIPANERQARELAKAPEEQRVEVWATVVEEAGESRITAKKVKEVVSRMTDEPEVEPPSFPPPLSPWPTKDEDIWFWELRNIYLQSPKRSRNKFKKWLEVEGQ